MQCNGQAPRLLPSTEVDGNGLVELSLEATIQGEARSASPKSIAPGFSPGITDRDFRVFLKINLA